MLFKSNMGQVRITHGVGDVLEREASVLEFIYGKREKGGCNSMGQSSGCVLHSDPACSSCGGRPFWTGEDPHFEKDRVSLGCSAITAKKNLFFFSMFYEFTHTHHPHHGSCRDVTAARKAKASLNLEKTRSCLQRVWACALLNPPL